jgi:quinoprotein glucose dehydrogenase
MVLKGGDWFGVVKKSENYGWKILGWGGTKLYRY